MSEFFGSVWWLLVTLGLLVTFHEFGHFWVARRCGVKVLRFSVGFGKPVWSRFGRDGVEYAIGAIPLGGYVKFLDAREAENPESAAHEPGEYNAAPVGKRMLIAVAGPVFNIVFTVFAFWAMFVVGRPDFQPVIGAPQGLAAAAGLQDGDRILSVDGDRVDSWSAAMLDVAQSAMLRRDATLQVATANGQTQTRTLALSQLPQGVADNDKTFDAIGLSLQPPPAIVGVLSAGGAAEKAGLHTGDRISAINGKPVASFADLVKIVPDQAKRDPRLHLTVQRGADTLGFDLTAERQATGGAERWLIGIGAADSHDALERYNPLRAVPAALRETWKTTSATLGMIGAMLTGAASTKNLSSVISIAQVANASAHMGLAWFLSFLAVISLSLGILNLLPIPLLDGGHLLYYAIEWVKGSPLSERTLIAGQYVGMAALAALMSLAFYNDILRLIAG
ncbi:MAG: RIP metalloprotease RseP [Proteobacteria bacterium]|nr:RIP metalloprotease RseP [Pseudomonadota bacterium]